MEEKNTIKEQLANAPKQIRDLLTSGNTNLIITEIAKKNNFSSNQTVSLENEVLFVLLGLELKGDLQKNVSSSLAIPEILAQHIAQEIHEKIFKQIEEFLPTESENEMLPGGNNLIEDTAGNADNIMPAVNMVTPAQNTTPVQEIPIKPALDILQRQTEPTALEQKLTNLTTPNNGNQVIQKNYAAQDPYREPIN